MKKPNPLWLIPPLAAGGAVLLPQLLDAATTFTPSPQVISVIPSGKWSNYDFAGTPYPFVASAVDWPVDMLWWNNAEIDKVKQILINDGWNGGTGGSMDLLYWDVTCALPYPGYQLWDDDSGRCGACETLTSDKRQKHTRLYAPDDPECKVFDQFADWSYGWGYYILGTTHYDYNHSGCSKSGGVQRFGWSELAEGVIGSRMSTLGYQVSQDYFPMQNYGYGDYPVSWHSDGQHYHQNDGYATTVRIP